MRFSLYNAVFFFLHASTCARDTDHLRAGSFFLVAKIARKNSNPLQ